MQQVEMPKIVFKKMSEVMNDLPKAVENSRLCPEMKNR